MDIYEFAGSVKLDRAALIALVMADTLGGGMLAIFVCWPTLLETLDAAKLAMISIAITLPFVTLGTFLYHFGFVGGDYDAVPERLSGSTVFAISGHLLYVLAALGGGAVAPLLPSPSWVPTLSPVSGFWTASALYLMQMLVLGQSLQHRRPWLRWLPVCGIVATGLGTSGYFFGVHRGWW